jgi:sugar lactone lactonase YvrE
MLCVVQAEILEAAPRGRLLRYEPATGALTTVLSGLHFPNGITLNAAGDALLLVESMRFRVLKLSLSALNKPAEVWSDNLPGFCDNLWRNPRTGVYLLG